VMTDTRPAITRRLPQGTGIIATDSARQAHNRPAITGVQGWFGSVSDCVDAALTGQWNGRA